MPTRFVVEQASQRHIDDRRRARVAIRRPGRGLERVARREHAHRPINSPTESLGIAPRACTGPRARAPAIHCGPWPGLVMARQYIARLTHRCSCRALQALRFPPITIYLSPAVERLVGRPPAAELGR
jgi:hypothetical protein